MTSPDIAERLDQLTNGWRPSGAATIQDLREARLHLADGLSSSEPTASIAQPLPAFQSRIGNSRSDTDSIAQLASSAAAVMTVVRNSTDVDPASGAAVIGMRVGNTLGPFVDPFGAAHWVDLIPLPPKIPIVSALQGVIGFLVVRRASGTLGSGSIWIAASGFNIPGAASGFVGLSFSGGTLSRTGNVTISPTGVHIGVGGQLNLQLTLSPPAAPPPRPGLGSDAAHMSLALPAHITINLTAAAATVAAIGDSNAKVYGTEFTLTRNDVRPRVVSAGVSYLLFPCDSSIDDFPFSAVLSTDVIPSGHASVTAAGWAFPITAAPPPQLGAAASAGTLLVELGDGVSLRFGELKHPASLASLTLVLSPGNITISALNGARDIGNRLTLWTTGSVDTLLQPLPSQHSPEIAVTIPRGALLFAMVSSQLERLVAFGRARANVDRPLIADGTRLPMAFASARLAFARSTTKSVTVLMSTPDLSPGRSLPRATIAIENALLRVGPSTFGYLHALYSGTRLVGAIEFTFENVAILPMLPDPYASANALPLPLLATVATLATWGLEPGAVLRFEIVGSPTPTGTPADLEERSPTTLLDLSGNADQFGVSFEALPRGQSVIAIDGMALAAPQQHLAVYALPGISWEPVVEASTGDWLDAPSPDDGPPTQLTVRTVNLVRLMPNVALPAFGQAGASADTTCLFTLPSGLMAELIMTSADPPEQRPSYSFVKGTYASGLGAAQQLSIRAQSVIHRGDAALPGNTTTGSPLPVPANSRVYGVLTLGNDPLGIARFFDQEFASSSATREIPVTRIDISGYGTSMFSDWRDPDFAVGVRRVRFDVALGRTSFETVQIATVIVPHCQRITRSVIFERYDSGLVLRQDTGWKAVGIAEFELLHSDQKLLGAVERLQNTHNITPGTGPTITVPGGTQFPGGLQFVPVTFDADIVMGPSVTAISHGKAGPLVAGTQIQGYAQLSVGPAATDRQILDLLQQLPDGVSGSVGCILNVGSEPGQNTPKFTLNVSSITAKATKATVAGQPYPAMAVALHGTPRLPRDGAWSITRRGQGDAQPSVVDPSFPIPLIFGSNNDNRNQWRLLDPADALSTSSPATLFGLMQGTGTSKSLFENPVVDSGGRSLLLDPGLGVPPPGLADIGALLGASGVFPNLASVLQVPTRPGDALNLAQDGFRKTFTWPVQKSAAEALDDQKLFDLGVVSLVLQYHGAKDMDRTQGTYTLDANPSAGSDRWSVTLAPLSLAVFVQGFGSDPLLSIHAAFEASETQKAGLKKITIDYGSALSLVRDIISGLTELVTALGGKVDMEVGFSDNKLTVHDGLTMPTIPLGFGEIKDVAIDLGVTIEIPDRAGFHVGLGSKEKPFMWIVDPLSGTGAIVLGAKDGDHSVYIEAGIGAALAIDVVVASGSASINLELSFAVQGSQFAITVALVGNASVDVLDGLASASLTLAAAITIIPEFDPGALLPSSVDLTAAVSVGIHISVAWVVSVDFDGSWSFSQNVPLHL